MLICRGDDALYACIFERYKRRTFVLARAAHLSRCDAEDVVAIVFLQAWRARDRAHFIDGSVLPWLTVVTTNIIRNQTRSVRRWAALHRILPLASSGEDAALIAERTMGCSALREAIRRALQTLPGRDADLVDMVLIQEVSLREAALALGTSEPAARSRLHRARRRLRAQLSPLEGRGDEF